MIVLMTRTRVKAESAAQVEQAAKRLFTAIRGAAPGNVRCSSSRLADGVTFVTVLMVDDGTENPLPSLPAYREFQEVLKPCVAEPPVAERGALVGSYRME